MTNVSKKLNFSEVKVGDIIKHVTSSSNYVVTAHYGDRITAVKTVDLTNPYEWETSAI